MRWLSTIWRRPEGRVKSFEADLRAAGGVAGRVDAGIQTVPIDQIVGSLDRWRTLRSDFFPRSGPSMTERHRRIADAMRREVPLPPLELYQLKGGGAQPERAVAGGYYVVDGHHRVAIARKLGQEYLEARVVQYRIPAEGTSPLQERPGSA